MRIIAGEFRSRRLEAPQGLTTRPTLDKVREAVFSSLGGSFEGGNVLDIYAGSGANGLEALSRGMEKAYFVDNDRRAVSAIRKNIASLGVQKNTKVLCMADTKALALLKEEGVRFSLIYMDPPYAKQKNSLILSLISEYELLEEGGYTVIESLKEDEFREDYPHLKYERDRVYGISRITYCKGV